MSKSWDIKNTPPNFDAEWIFRTTAEALEDLATYGHLHGRNHSMFEKAEMRIQAELWRQAADDLDRDTVGESLRHFYPFGETE